MKAQEFEELIPDYILGKLTDKQNVAFNSYLKQHPDALEEWNLINRQLNKEELEPSEGMDAKFYEFLNTETNRDNDTQVKQLVTQRTINYSRFLMPLIAASIMLLFGFFVGKQWNTNPTVSPNLVNTESVQEMRQETDDVRTQLVMSLANESSASKRLQALSEATKLDNATEQVIIALFKMLNTDTNINVRLAAVASLSKYVDNPKVREGLVLSIIKQDSPLVQIALADLMVTLKEQTSINSMETLLQQPDINAAVKQKLEESIKQII
jgi:hypothetical protein